MPRCHGCTGIDGAPYPLQSTSTPPQLLIGVTNLQIGDRITITANGLLQGMQLQSPLGNMVLPFGAMSSISTDTTIRRLERRRKYTVWVLDAPQRLGSVSGGRVVGELHRSIAVQRLRRGS